MAPDYRNYLLGQAITGAVISLLLNGAIGWLRHRQPPRVPLYGPQSIAGDVVGTSLLLPLLICLTATPLIRGEIRRAPPPTTSWLGSGSHRAVRLLVGVDGLAFWAFVPFKASLAAARAAGVTPIVAMRTLGDGVQASGVRSIAGY